MWFWACSCIFQWCPISNFLDCKLFCHAYHSSSLYFFLDLLFKIIVKNFILYFIFFYLLTSEPPVSNLLTAIEGLCCNSMVSCSWTLWLFFLKSKQTLFCLIILLPVPETWFFWADYWLCCIGAPPPLSLSLSFFLSFLCAICNILPEWQWAVLWLVLFLCDNLNNFLVILWL